MGRTHNTTQKSNLRTFAFLIILPLMALIPNKVFSQWSIKAYLDCNPNPISVHIHCNSTGDDETITLTGGYNCCGWYLKPLVGTGAKVSCTCPDATITLGTPGVPVLLSDIISSPIPPSNPSYPYIFCCTGTSNPCTINGCGVVTVDPITSTITISKPVWCP